MKGNRATMRDIEAAALDHEKKIFDALGIGVDDARIFGLSKENTAKVLEIVRVTWQDGFQSGWYFGKNGGILDIHPEDDGLKVIP